MADEKSTEPRGDTPVSVFELREVASGRIGYGDTKWHLHLLGLAAVEIDRLRKVVRESHAEMAQTQVWNHLGPNRRPICQCPDCFEPPSELERLNALIAENESHL